MNEFGKYRLFRKYFSEDGVNYTPLDEYQALLVENDSCQCGYREFEYRWDGEYKEETFKTYEIWNEYSFCPNDSSYDELTGNVDYRNPITADGVMLATYRGGGSNYVQLCNNEDFFQSMMINNVVLESNTEAYRFYNTDINEVAFSNVTTIGDGTFYRCKNLISITIPDGVTSIGNETFESCSNLTSVIIPSSVTSIGDSAFDSCSSLTSIIIPDSVTSIGENAFRYCSSLTSIIIPDSVTSIGERDFQSCTSLTSVTIGSGVTTIGSAAFNNCSSLTSIVIPDSVTTIGNNAFLYCSSLTSVTIGSGVTSIGDSAFQYCTRLTSITCYATTAPSLGDIYVFDDLPSGILKVPKGSNYRNWLTHLSTALTTWTIEYI